MSGDSRFIVGFEAKPKTLQNYSTSICFNLRSDLLVLSTLLLFLQTTFPKTLKMVFAGSIREDQPHYSDGVRQTVLLLHQNVSGAPYATFVSLLNALVNS